MENDRVDDALVNVTPIRLGTVSAVFRQNPGTGIYPADRIQKGLALALQNTELVEEGIGFGVPLLKLGHKTIFPGRSHVVEQKPGTMIKINYHLNLVQRMRLRNDKIASFSLLYPAQEWFSKLHRKLPPLRGFISQSGRILRRTAGLKTAFEEIETVATVVVTYSLDGKEDTIVFSADLSALPDKKNMEIIMANEQGASHFDVYRDSAGITRTGKEIGSWQVVMADHAFFTDPHHGITFSLATTAGAKLFRGREVVPEQLAWAGLDYVLSTHPHHFTYEILVNRI
ncbi:MAG: hypothetical protein HY529_05765 [Chloroflexi bacterium]|nr:hypothetical protein [Chloroflexota bacterium]